jgi:hypothetical protein
MNRVLLRVGLSAAAVGAIVAGFGLTAVARDIRRQSQVDEAQPADVIVVLGAAEYRGRPSPVLEARLNHALFLYLQNMAPRILATGGADGDPVAPWTPEQHNEAIVHAGPRRRRARR